MRTTLALDEDVFLFARQRAQLEKSSLGEIISKYARIGISNAESAQIKTPTKSVYGLLPARDEVITNEHVYRLIEAEGI